MSQGHVFETRQKEKNAPFIGGFIKKVEKNATYGKRAGKKFKRIRLHERENHDESTGAAGKSAFQRETSRKAHINLYNLREIGIEGGHEPLLGERRHHERFLKTQKIRETGKRVQ